MADHLQEIEARLAMATPFCGCQVVAQKITSTISSCTDEKIQESHAPDLYLQMQQCDLHLNAPTDLAYLLRRFRAAEAVIKTFGCAESVWDHKGCVEDMERACLECKSLTTWREAAR